jgi:hypothetical protein
LKDSNTILLTKDSPPHLAFKALLQPFNRI